MNPENGGAVFKAGSITFEYKENAQVMVRVFAKNI